MHGPRHALGLASLAATLSACEAFIDVPESARQPPAGGTCDPTSAPAPTRIVRLARLELEASLSELAQTPVSAQVPADALALGFSNGASQGVDSLYAEGLQRTAEAVAS